MILHSDPNYAIHAQQMEIVAATVRGDSDYHHDLRCGYAVAIHNGASAIEATDDAVDFANAKREEREL